MEQEPLSQIDVSHQLRLLMVQYDLTVNRMAELAGVSKSAMEKYLSGPSSPRATAIVSLSRALNVTTDYILQGQLDIDASVILSASRITLRDVFAELLSDNGRFPGFRTMQPDSEDARQFMQNLAHETAQVIRNRAIEERDELKRSGVQITAL